jgi:hypothetical protein
MVKIEVRTFGNFGKNPQRVIRKMDNFVCIPLEYRGEFLFCVYENTTEQVIRAFYFEEDATSYIKFLNRGGAFGGWTPAFILTEYDLDRENNINNSFENALS